jgi:hypothetical protein
VSYCEDSLVKSMKATARNPLLDRRMGVAKPPQLPNRNDTMLAMGQSRQLLPTP